MKAIDARDKARRMALTALRRARRAAERAGVELSDWEGEFLGSVEARVEKYGRAFADPDKGAMGASLSLRQGLKLKEITAKAKRQDRPQDKLKDKRKDKSARKPGGLKRRPRPARSRHGK